MDFIEDRLATGRKFRTFNVVDAFTRKGLASEVDTSLPGARVVEALDRLVETRACPEELVLDNGPEFIGRALDRWAEAPRGPVPVHHARQAGPERAHRELPRSIPG